MNNDKLEVMGGSTVRSVASFTLKEIIQRKITYCQNNDDAELADMYAGYLRGFQQMLIDMDLTEEAFIQKYLNIVKDLKTTFESFEEKGSSAGNVDALSGYNNAVIDVLSLLNEKYLYDENW